MQAQLARTGRRKPDCFIYPMNESEKEFDP